MTQYVVVYHFNDGGKPELGYLVEEDDDITLYYDYTRATKYYDLNQAYHLLNRSHYTSNRIRVEEAT